MDHKSGNDLGTTCYLMLLLLLVLLRNWLGLFWLYIQHQLAKETNLSGLLFLTASRNLRLAQNLSTSGYFPASSTHHLKGTIKYFDHLKFNPPMHHLKRTSRFFTNVNNAPSGKVIQSETFLWILISVFWSVGLVGWLVFHYFQKGKIASLPTLLSDHFLNPVFWKHITAIPNLLSVFVHKYVVHTRYLIEKCFFN